jgi:hypothetical protein
MTESGGSCVNGNGVMWQWEAKYDDITVLDD